MLTLQAIERRLNDETLRSDGYDLVPTLQALAYPMREGLREPDAPVRHTLLQVTEIPNSGAASPSPLPRPVVLYSGG